MSRRAALVALAAFIAACAGDEPLLAPVVTPCPISSRDVDAYTASLADLVVRQLRLDALERHEMVSVSFALAADGSASDIRATRTSRPAAAREAIRAAAAAAPYPPPSFDPKACLTGGRATLWLVGHARCDDLAASAYVDAVSARVQRAVVSAGVTAPEHERIALRVAIDRQGAVTAISVIDAPSPQRAKRVAAIARRLSPFAAPGAGVSECLVEQPFFVWVELRGASVSAQ